MMNCLNGEEFYSSEFFRNKKLILICFFRISQKEIGKNRDSRKNVLNFRPKTEEENCDVLGAKA